MLLATLYFEEISRTDSIMAKRTWFWGIATYISDSEVKQLCFIVLFVSEHRSISDKNLATQIFNELLPRLEAQNYIAIAGVSNACEHFNELAKAFDKTLQALNQQLIQSSSFNCKFFFYSSELISHKIIWNKTDELLFRIEAGNETEIKNLITELFLFYRNIPNCTLQDVKYHCYQIADQCRSLLQEYLNISSIPDMSSSMQNIINHMFRLEEIKIYYLQFMINLNAMIVPKSIYAVNNVIEKICIYMQ